METNFIYFQVQGQHLFYSRRALNPTKKSTMKLQLFHGARVIPLPDNIINRQSLRKCKTIKYFMAQQAVHSTILHQSLLHTHQSTFNFGRIKLHALIKGAFNFTHNKTR